MREAITLQDFMIVINYRITESDKFLWMCYGPNAYCMHSWNGDHDGHSVDVVFDTVTQTVYELNACDYKRNLAYRWINPSYREAFNKEAITKNSSPDEAWDGVTYINLDMADDILEKCSCIVNGTDYDTRVQVPIELNDSDLLKLFIIAHERDITLNKLIEELLRDEIWKLQND